MTALVVLPLLALVGWSAVAATRLGWRDGILVGFLLWLTGWQVGAAVLSLVEQLNVAGVLASQVTQLVAQTLLLRRRRPPLPALGRGWRDPWVLVLAAQALVLLVLAMSAAPTNWDSMRYHLPKIAQWLQAERVTSFPTEFAPQVYLSFLSELGMAQFAVLTGALWTLNLVQYCGHLVALVAVSALARNVGVDRRGQAIAAGVFGLSPLVVGQAVTTQNDYLMCTLVVIAYAMALRRSGGAPWLVVVALASGLAVAVKPTAVLMVLPAVFLALRHLRGLDVRRAALPLVASLVLGLGTNAWWMVNNHQTWGSLSGVDSELTNVGISLDTVATNLVKNLSQHLALPDPGANLRLESGVRNLLASVGMDADDPDSNFGTFVVVSTHTEDRAGNPLQVLLIAIALGALLLAGRRSRALWPLAGSMLVVCVAAAAVLRWQPWGGRFLLTVLALGAVLVGAAWSRWPRWVSLVTLCALTVGSLPYLLEQQLRPLRGEGSVLRTSAEEELFRGLPQLREPYEAVADSVRDDVAPRIGLAEGMWQWEFPMWWLVKRSNPDAILGNATPCAETATRERPEWDVVVTWRDVSGEEYSHTGGCAH